MAIPKSPYETTISGSWLWTIHELERRLTLALSDERTGPYFDSMRNLCLLIDLTRQIAATQYGQSYRAGTSLRETLVISTATCHGLEPEEPFIAVGIEPTDRNTAHFYIEYYKGGDRAEEIRVLKEGYETVDMDLIEANLRRDLIEHYKCEYAEAWEIIQPLMVRLWNETH